MENRFYHLEINESRIIFWKRYACRTIVAKKSHRLIRRIRRKVGRVFHPAGLLNNSPDNNMLKPHEGFRLLISLPARMIILVAR